MNDQGMISASFCVRNWVSFQTHVALEETGCCQAEQSNIECDTKRLLSSEIERGFKLTPGTFDIAQSPLLYMSLFPQTPLLSQSAETKAQTLVARLKGF